MLLRNLRQRATGKARAETGTPVNTTNTNTQNTQNTQKMKPVAKSIADRAVEPTTPSQNINLIDLLQDSDRIPESNRLAEQAETGLIHVSSLPEICPRALALAEDYQTLDVLFKNVSSNDRIVWAMGRAAEKHVRDTLIPKLGINNVLGSFLCPCGHTEHTPNPPQNPQSLASSGLRRVPRGTILEPVSEYPVCSRCNNPVSIYQEQRLIDPTVNVVGNSDLIYRNAEGKWVVLEIKSMKGDMFKELTARHDQQKGSVLTTTVNGHIYQATAYHKLLTNLGYDVAESVKILYVSKNYLRQAPYKEYDITVNETMRRRLVVEWEKAEVYKNYRDQKEARGTAIRLPPRLGVCQDCMSTRAKSCPVVEPCFNSTR